MTWSRSEPLNVTPGIETAASPLSSPAIPPPVTKRLPRPLEIATAPPSANATFEAAMRITPAPVESLARSKAKLPLRLSVPTVSVAPVASTRTNGEARVVSTAIETDQAGHLFDTLFSVTSRRWSCIRPAPDQTNTPSRS